MIPLKSENDLALLRISGLILARVMQQLRQIIRAGITTGEINQLAEALLEKEDAQPAFKGYKGFPASICTSVNEEIVHGIPGSRILKEGDIISLDLGVLYKDYYADAAVTLPVGAVSADLRKLMSVTKASLAEGIRQVRVNNRVSDISHAVQSHVEKHGFSVVRQFVGHGIGSQLHEEPEIPNFGKPHTGPVLKEGMVLAIEPMVNVGSWESEILENGWTAVTKDRLASAHFEHTVAVTKRGPEIITQLP